MVLPISKNLLLETFVSIVAHVCGDPMSRYTCRATRVAADFLRFSCVAMVSHYTPLKGPVAPTVLGPLPGVSQVKLALKGVALKGHVTAILASVALHCGTIFVKGVLVGLSYITHF